MTCTGTTHSLSALEVIHTCCSASNCPLLASSSAEDWCKALSPQDIYPFLVNLKIITYNTTLARTRPVVMQQGRSVLQYSQPRSALLRLPIPAIKLPAKTNWIMLRSDYVRAGLQGLFTEERLVWKELHRLSMTTRKERKERDWSHDQSWTPGERRTKRDKMQGK